VSIVIPPDENVLRILLFLASCFWLLRDLKCIRRGITIPDEPGFAGCQQAEALVTLSYSVCHIHGIAAVPALTALAIAYAAPIALAITI
jgi:hypothetical protein